MRRRTVLSGLVFLALAVPLAVRAGHFASAPGFEPGIVHYRRPRLELRDVEMLRLTEQGSLRIRARAARPGHERVGFFELGPSTFFALERIRARCTAERDAGWELRAETARLGQGKILARDRPVLIMRGGRMLTPEAATIHLRSGRLVTR